MFSSSAGSGCVKDCFPSSLTPSHDPAPSLTPTSTRTRKRAMSPHSASSCRSRLTIQELLVESPHAARTCPDATSLRASCHSSPTAFCSSLQLPSSRPVVDTCSGCEGSVSLPPRSIRPGRRFKPWETTERHARHDSASWPHEAQHSPPQKSSRRSGGTRSCRKNPVSRSTLRWSAVFSLFLLGTHMAPFVQGRALPAKFLPDASVTLPQFVPTGVYNAGRGRRRAVSDSRSDVASPSTSDPQTSSPARSDSTAAGTSSGTSASTSDSVRATTDSVTSTDSETSTASDAATSSSQTVMTSVTPANPGGSTSTSTTISVSTFGTSSTSATSSTSTSNTSSTSGTSTLATTSTTSLSSSTSATTSR
ncbi:hypothetical protein BD309DRAFT_585131 [Dichomitus squalens]|nr:hypothetical protein BD309DRAFT_585131 [Dichomitus squalens]